MQEEIITPKDYKQILIITNVFFSILLFVQCMYFNTKFYNNITAFYGFLLFMFFFMLPFVIIFAIFGVRNLIRMKLKLSRTKKGYKPTEKIFFHQNIFETLKGG